MTTEKKLEVKPSTLKQENIRDRLPKEILKICKKFDIGCDEIDFESELQSIKDSLDQYSEIVELVAKHSSLNPADKEVVKAELLKYNLKKQEDITQELVEQENKVLIQKEEDNLMKQFKDVSDKKLLNSPSFYQAAGSGQNRKNSRKGKA